MPTPLFTPDDRDHEPMDFGPVPPRPQPPNNHPFPPDDGIEIINLDDDRRPVKPTTWH
jgi:hypothetical protein